MKLLMQIAALAATSTLAACGGGDTQANQTAAENGMMDNGMATDAAAMNATGGMDANAMMGANGMMDANATMDANTHNAMMNDMKTNDPDTNLANGM